MAIFGGLVITNKGRNILSKCQSGKLLKFKKIVVGDGELGSSESISNISELKNQILICDINNIKVNEDNIAKVTFILTNKELNQGFYWRELGIIAEDPDTAEEILYLYGNARDNGEYISEKGGADVIEKYITININVSNVANIKTIIDESEILVSKKELEDKIKTKIEIITTTEEIEENTDYEIPCNYKVGQDTLDIYYMGERLIKGEHYIEVGENGTVSNKIQFYNWGQSVPIDRTIEFIVRGVYEDEA